MLKREEVQKLIEERYELLVEIERLRGRLESYDARQRLLASWIHEAIVKEAGKDAA